MFYLASKFHDNRVNTFGFMEGPGEAQELQKKPRPNRVVNSFSSFVSQCF